MMNFGSLTSLRADRSWSVLLTEASSLNVGGKVKSAMFYTLYPPSLARILAELGLNAIFLAYSFLLRRLQRMYTPIIQIAMSKMVVKMPTNKYISSS